MKGIVFTEFLEMVEASHSPEMVDDIIDDAAVPSGGAYTAVGTYDHTEMAALVSALSRRTGTPVAELLQVFGKHLFFRFHALYPTFFRAINDPLIFLSGIEDIIHAEVRKLYPDAELPAFVAEEFSAGRLVLLYESSRHLEDLAEGLIQGCLQHFGGGSVSREAVCTGDAHRVRFVILRA